MLLKVIMLDKIAKLGSVGEIVNVKAGYARNFLIPQGKAVPATKTNVASFEKRRAELASKLVAVQLAAEARAQQINLLGRVIIKTKAGKEGKLFGSIGTNDIANAIINAGIKVVKSEVRLPNGVLRNIGDHEVFIHVSSEVLARLHVQVVNENDFKT